MKTGGGAVAISKQGGSQMNSTKLGNNKRNKIAQICQKATVHQVSRFAEFTYLRVAQARTTHWVAIYSTGVQ